jgi:mannose-6-phosphate isomerase-like protein (cupin superfamily)
LIPFPLEVYRVIVVRIPMALKQLERMDERARGKTMFTGDNYTAGLVALSPGETTQAPVAQVGKDLMAVVMQGRGFLRVPTDEVYLEPGTVVRVPSGMPHQFVATGTEDLVMVLVSVEVGTTLTVPTLREALG